MTIDDERELRRRLDDALEAITPSPAPVATTVRRGRTMRARRRIGVAAGLAAAAGIALAAPSLVRQLVHQAPVAPAKPTVTVNRLGPNAVHGVIGSGKINGKSWQIQAQQPGVGGVPKGEQCFLAADVVGTQACGPVSSPSANGGDPVDFSALGSGTAQVLYGGVAPDVTHVNVTLVDGTVLVLHPTKAYGQRYVAFAIPVPLAVARVVAYSRHGDLGYSIPFNDGSGATIATWLHPGQRGLPRRSYRIGSGSVSGSAWSEAVHVGPWGYCLTGPIGGCFDTESRSLGNRMGPNDVGSGRGPGWLTGTAAAAVDHVRAMMSGGRTLTVPAYDAGGPRFFAFAVPNGVRVIRLDYYSPSGRRLASRSGKMLY